MGSPATQYRGNIKLICSLAVAFFGILVGAVISVVTYVLWLHFSYQPRASRPDTSIDPEARLIPGQIGAICIPICLFIFAWTSRPGYVWNGTNRKCCLLNIFSVHWIVPIIGTAFFAPGFYLTFQSILNYLGESYPRHVASVFAGNTFFRSSFGGALPLAAPRMLQSLGIGWASSTLGFISIAMLPLPFILERVCWNVFQSCLSHQLIHFDSMERGYGRGANSQTRV